MKFLSVFCKIPMNKLLTLPLDCHFQDAIRFENGRELNNYNIVVEWAKKPTRPGVSSFVMDFGRDFLNEEFVCCAVR